VLDVLLVVQEVMGQVVTDVAKDPSTEHSCCCVPIIEENRVGELVERGCEHDEEGRRHDEAVSVHREVMVDAVEEEMGCYADSIIW